MITVVVNGDSLLVSQIMQAIKAFFLKWVTGLLGKRMAL